MMTLEEYTQAVADAVGGKAQEVEKNGAKLWAVILPKTENIAPIFYTESFLQNGYSVERMSEYIKRFEAPQIDVNGTIKLFTDGDYSKIKPRLFVRLVNDNASDSYIGINAGEYGFDDLRVVPYFDVNEEMSFRLAEWHIDKIGLPLEQIVQDAIDNTTFNIVDLLDVMKRYCPDEDLGEETRSMMFLVNDHSAGAGAILKAKDTLEKMFPNGYIAIPSSVDEFIIVPNFEGMDEVSEEYVNSLINTVNSDMLRKEEVLSNRFYQFLK